MDQPSPPPASRPSNSMYRIRGLCNGFKCWLRGLSRDSAPTGPRPIREVWIYVSAVTYVHIRGRDFPRFLVEELPGFECGILPTLGLATAPYLDVDNVPRLVREDDEWVIDHRDVLVKPTDSSRLIGTCCNLLLPLGGIAHLAEVSMKKPPLFGDP